MAQIQKQQQLINLKQKYEICQQKFTDQVKRNNNLIKMNSNLMRENEKYQNCFISLRKWKNTFFSYPNESQNSDLNEQFYQNLKEDQSLIDIQEQGQDFVNTLISEIEQKINTLIQNNFSKINTQNLQIDKRSDNFSKMQQNTNQDQQCEKCSRWKQLYVKQNTQTLRLQKIIDSSSLINSQKHINFIKLKDDVCKLLQDYWILYRKQLNINADLISSKQKNPQNDTNYQKKSQNKKSIQRIQQAETIRYKSKQKRSSSSESKTKNKDSLKVFLKNKTVRNNKYQIDLKGKSINNGNKLIADQSQKQYDSFQQPNIKQIKRIMESMSEFNKFLQQENSQLKEQLKEFNEILIIYREKERSRILYQ